MNNKTFIFDFDSTFIQVETLDVLAEVCLSNHPEKNIRLDSIRHITQLAMEGKYSYYESLKERVPLFNITPAHLEQTIEIIKQKITPSILRNKSFFKKYADQIYIFSGAFVEIIWPIVQPFGFKRNHVFGNHLLYDFEGNILGYDEQNPLAQDQGKVKLAHKLKLPHDVIVIGDGYTDYELKAAELATSFFAFVENIRREPVIKQADAVLEDLEGLFITCNLPYSPPLSRKKALLVENIHPSVSRYFQNCGYEVESIAHALEPKDLIDKLKGVSILGIRSKSELNHKVLEQCLSLEAIGAFCIGTNQIDLKYCTQNGIAAFNAPFSNTRSVVELAIGEMILLLRRAASSNHKLRQGVWDKSSQGAHEVRGKTLGIIGYGNIGSQLSILAEALGMRVLFYDIADKLPLGNAKSCHSMEDLLDLSDVVSIHVDGRKENHHLISYKEFDMMKQDVILLNLSRGFVVDEKALIHNLKTKKVAGLGVDVYEEEPHESKAKFKTALQEFDNVILTPHIGGSTEEAQSHIGEYVSKNLSAYLNEGTSLGSVNFPQLSLMNMNHLQRVLHIHKNVPGILAQINRFFAECNINIEGQALKTNDDIGYVITDINHDLDENTLTKLQRIPHTIKVRIINKSI